MKLRAFVFVAGFGASAFLASADEKGVGYNGVWAGATVRDQNLGFVVERGAVTQLEIEWRIRLDEPCQLDPGSPIAATVLGGTDTWYFHANSPGHEPLKIENAAWSLQQSPMGGRSNVSLSIQGRFSGDEATGDLVLKMMAGCKGQLTTTWRATRVKARATSGVAMAPAPVTAQVLGAPHPRLTPQFFDMILRAKMTQAAIEGVLGPGKLSDRPGVPADMREIVWEDEGGSMTVQFKEGRASGGVTKLRDPR